VRGVYSKAHAQKLADNPASMIPAQTVHNLYTGRAPELFAGKREEFPIGWRWRGIYGTASHYLRR